MRLDLVIVTFGSWVLVMVVLLLIWGCIENVRRNCFVVVEMVRFWECTLGGTGELGCEAFHIRYPYFRNVTDENTCKVVSKRELRRSLTVSSVPREVISVDVYNIV